MKLLTVLIMLEWQRKFIIIITASTSNAKQALRVEFRPRASLGAIGVPAFFKATRDIYLN